MQYTQTIYANNYLIYYNIFTSIFDIPHNNCKFSLQFTAIQNKSKLFYFLTLQIKYKWNRFHYFYIMHSNI